MILWYFNLNNFIVDDISFMSHMLLPSLERAIALELVDEYSQILAKLFCICFKTLNTQ